MLGWYRKSDIKDDDYDPREEVEAMYYCRDSEEQREQRR